ncbi:hypothetical protein QTO34_013766 [Cnephaeus nilssonii]|uniref:Uncharacterized protein n=1 Tax=Cnephaeus nilssonii TaxID=3371016 RepID=A0AA40LSZ2_CNENI|nr:hypothetical protein QTO34_013766 [Eptesicus nilssonii]
MPWRKKAVAFPHKWKEFFRSLCIRHSKLYGKRQEKWHKGNSLPEVEHRTLLGSAHIFVQPTSSPPGTKMFPEEHSPISCKP